MLCVEGVESRSYFHLYPAAMAVAAQTIDIYLLKHLQLDSVQE